MRYGISFDTPTVLEKRQFERSTIRPQALSRSPVSPLAEGQGEAGVGVLLGDTVHRSVQPDSRGELCGGRREVGQKEGEMGVRWAVGGRGVRGTEEGEREGGREVGKRGRGRGQWEGLRENCGVHPLTQLLQ